ncbi:glycerol kinase GlpK [Thermatribacter velox]|uniref:ATP:glycerol 3-phosphotransferase n=1 Tax=Thermatribacter velox TaxID=3039681 RepID=A0ABZ2YBQ0_9BACT|nr:glycerol kinase [Candidatus Atribacteria bacterium]
MSLSASYVLVIDQSTTGTKAILFDESCRPVERANAHHKQYYPRPGWVEHDPVEIVNCTYEACKKLIEKAEVDVQKIRAIGITNQRETVVAWDREGRPIYNAIVWQCQRGKELCDSLREAGYGNFVKERTGLLLDPYFSASKIAWIFSNLKSWPGSRELQWDEILVGTIDSWLVWNFTGGKMHATDYSNASRTMLLNIDTLEWDEEILELFSIPRSVLPELLPSDALFGYTDLGGILPNPLPIAAVMGDSSAALYGQLGYEFGAVKATYGTGTSIMVNTGNTKYVARSAVTSVGWFVNEKPTFVLEGNIHSSGDTIRWLIEEVGLYSAYEEVEQLAKALDDNQGVYLVPAFVGLGAPYWKSGARALICGLSRGVDKRHFARAAVESIAYQVFDLFEAIAKEGGFRFELLRADGGATRNDFLMQFQADLLRVPVAVSSIEECSARGVALLAAQKVGILDEQALSLTSRLYEPRMDLALRNQYLSGWHKAVERAMLGV